MLAIFLLLTLVLSHGGYNCGSPKSLIETHFRSALRPDEYKILKKALFEQGASENSAIPIVSHLVLSQQEYPSIHAAALFAESVVHGKNLIKTWTESYSVILPKDICVTRILLMGAGCPDSDCIGEWIVKSFIKRSDVVGLNNFINEYILDYGEALISLSGTVESWIFSLLLDVISESLIEDNYYDTLILETFLSDRENSLFSYVAVSWELIGRKVVQRAFYTCEWRLLSDFVAKILGNDYYRIRDFVDEIMLKNLVRSRCGHFILSLLKVLPIDSHYLSASHMIMTLDDNYSRPMGNISQILDAIHQVSPSKDFAMLQIEDSISTNYELGNFCRNPDLTPVVIYFIENGLIRNLETFLSVSTVNHVCFNALIDYLSDGKDVYEFLAQFESAWKYLKAAIENNQVGFMDKIRSNLSSYLDYIYADRDRLDEFVDFTTSKVSANGLLHLVKTACMYQSNVSCLYPLTVNILHFSTSVFGYLIFENNEKMLWEYVDFIETLNLHHQHEFLSSLIDADYMLDLEESLFTDRFNCWFLSKLLFDPDKTFKELFFYMMEHPRKFMRSALSCRNVKLMEWISRYLGEDVVVNILTSRGSLKRIISENNVLAVEFLADLVHTRTNRINRVKYGLTEFFTVYNVPLGSSQVIAILAAYFPFVDRMIERLVNSDISRLPTFMLMSFHLHIQEMLEIDVYSGPSFRAELPSFMTMICMLQTALFLLSHQSDIFGKESLVAGHGLPWEVRDHIIEYLVPCLGIPVVKLRKIYRVVATYFHFGWESMCSDLGNRWHYIGLSGRSMSNPNLISNFVYETPKESYDLACICFHLYYSR